MSVAEWLRLPTRRHASGTWVTCDRCRQMVSNSRAYTVYDNQGEGAIYVQSGRRCFPCAVKGVKRDR